MRTCPKCAAPLEGAEEVCRQCAVASAATADTDLSQTPPAPADPDDEEFLEHERSVLRKLAFTPIERESWPVWAGRLGFKMGAVAALTVTVAGVLTQGHGDPCWLLMTTVVTVPVFGIVGYLLFWSAAAILDGIAGVFSKPPPEVRKALAKYEKQDKEDEGERGPDGAGRDASVPHFAATPDEANLTEPDTPLPETEQGIKSRRPES